MAEKMEVVAGTICVLGLSGAIILAHLPAYLTGVILFCAWSSVILELKQIDVHILESELGWKLRRDCSKGVFCALLIPCAVLLTTFHNQQLQDDFSKMLIIMSVAAILVPLAILSYTLLLTAQRTGKTEGGDTKPGTASDKNGKNILKDKDKEESQEKENNENERHDEMDKEKDMKLEKEKSKSQKQSKTTKSKKDKPPICQTEESPIATKSDSVSKPKSESSSKTKLNANNSRNSMRSEDSIRSTTVTTNKPSAQNNNASSNTSMGSTPSPSASSTASSSTSTTSVNTGAHSTSSIQLEKNLSTVLNVCHLVIVVALMLFTMMISLRTLGFKATVLLGMHSLLLSILLTTLPVLTPRSFSLGEATAAAQALMYFQLLLSSQLWYKFEWLKIDSTLLTSVTDVTAFTEVALLSCMLVVVVLLFWPSWRNSVRVYVLIPGIAAVFSLPSLYAVLGTDFVSWVLRYVASDVTKRYLFVYWALSTVLAVVSVYFNTSYLKQLQEAAKPTFHLPAKIRNRIRATQTQQQASTDPPPLHQRRSSTDAKIEAEVAACRGGVTTAVRKQFHALAVCVFIPGLVLDPPFTMCAWSCALVVFIMLECLRIVEVYPWYTVLDEYLKVFLDSRDEGPVILTPIYLLAGCTLPLWIYQGPGNGTHIVLFSGVLSLGIGDTAASVFGSKFGRHKWPGCEKSIEGTIANVMSQALFLWAFAQTGYCPVFSWDRVLPAIVLTSLVEAFTLQIDNLVLPLLMYCLTVS